MISSSSLKQTGKKQRLAHEIVSFLQKDEMTISVPGMEEERRVATSKLCDVIPLSDFESLLKECGVTGFASEWTKRCHGTGGGEKKQDVDDAPKPKTLGDMFKAKEGQWRCSTCMTMNDATAAEKCAACETAKPGASKPPAAAAAGAAPGLQFGFGAAPAAPSGLQFGFGGTPVATGADAVEVSANGSTSFNGDQEDVDENDDMDEASSMDESSSLLDSEDYDSDVGVRESESTGVSPAPATSAPKTLGDMFKAKEGDWRCTTCMTMNPATASDKCLACETAKPGASKPPAAAAAASGAAPGLQFGFGAAAAAPAAASSPAPGGLQFGFGGTPASGGAAAIGSGLTFGFGGASGSTPKSESTTQAAGSSAPAGGSMTFGFGAASGGEAPKFNFGSGAAPSSASTSSQGNPAPFSFGTSAASSQPAFSFGGSAPSQPPAFSFGAPPK